MGQVPVALFLERLEEENFDAFSPWAQVRDWKLPWRIWRSFHQRTF